nr:unknown [Homo sapiens]
MEGPRRGPEVGGFCKYRLLRVSRALCHDTSLGLTWLRTCSVRGFVRTLPFCLKLKAKENDRRLRTELTLAPGWEAAALLDATYCKWPEYQRGGFHGQMHSRCLPLHLDHLVVFKFLVPEAKSTTCLLVTCLPAVVVDVLAGRFGISHQSFCTVLVSSI